MTGFDVVVAQSTGGQSIVGPVFVFVVNLIIGAIAIYGGARLLIDTDVGFRRAIFTALIGAIVWAVVALFLGWIPIIGPLLTLIIWIGVINWQYPGGWGTAIGIGIVAWIIAVIILYVLATLGIIGFGALGIPGA